MGTRVEPPGLFVLSRAFEDIIFINKYGNNLYNVNNT